MLVDFFLHLKARQLPVSTKELLVLLEALQARLVGASLDDFYLLARAILIKDEALYDRFDRAFGEYFKGVETLPDAYEITVEDLEGALKKQNVALRGGDAVLVNTGWHKLYGDNEDYFARAPGFVPSAGHWFVEKKVKVVGHDKVLSMAWCLKCHNEPDSSLRPVDKVTDLTWTPGGGDGTRKSSSSPMLM